MYTNTTSNESTVNILLEAGAEVNLVDNKGYTALMYAIIYTREETKLSTIMMLLDVGADLEKKNNDGLTALDLAMERMTTTSTPETVDLLKRMARFRVSRR